MIVIVGRSCVFSHNYDDVVFTRISCMTYITSFKMIDGISLSFYLLILYTNFTLQFNIFIPDGI